MELSFHLLQFLKIQAQAQAQFLKTKLSTDFQRPCWFSQTIPEVVEFRCYGNINIRCSFFWGGGGRGEGGGEEVDQEMETNDIIQL